MCIQVFFFKKKPAQVKTTTKGEEKQEEMKRQERQSKFTGLFGLKDTYKLKTCYCMNKL